MTPYRGVQCVNCVFVLKRKGDGKYYRGARWWRWTRNWKRAAILNMEWWEFVLQMPHAPETDSVSLVNVNEILDAEWFK